MYLVFSDWLIMSCTRHINSWARLSMSCAWDK